MNIINDEINPVKSLIEGQPYMLMSKFGDMDPEERDIKRATIIRKIGNATMFSVKKNKRYPIATQIKEAVLSMSIHLPKFLPSYSLVSICSFRIFLIHFSV